MFRGALIPAVAASILASPSVATAQTAVWSFEQPSMPLGQALTRVADVAGHDVLFPSQAVSGRVAPGIRGRMTVDEALARVLAGSGLSAHLSDGVIIVARVTGEEPPPTVLDEVVVTGNQTSPRTIQDSPVPVDVMSAHDVRSTGFVDTNDMLRALIPSFTVARNPNSDAGTFVRPAALRGLPGDKTLLLVNSKRRHRSAAVSASGFGSQAADAATIPASAIQSMEVMRDGAAALYGSDAVAGVINFLLKEDASGGSFTSRVGQYYEGDGEDVFLAGNLGLPLTEAGFLNLSAEYNQASRTSRGGPYCNATFCAADYATANPAYGEAVDVTSALSAIGQPELEALRGVVNAGIDLSPDTRLYAFANLSRSTATTDAFYRYPSGGQPILDVPVRLPDGTVFRFNEILPYGYTPNYSAIITDYSLVTGVSGIWSNGLGYDFSVRFGADRMKYKTANTLNPTLGPESPRAFTRANYVAEEAAINADFTQSLSVPGSGPPALLAFGFEYRNESFESQSGEPLAYASGPYGYADPWGFCAEGATAPAGVDCSDPDDPVYNTLPALTLTVSPAQAGRLDRQSLAAYGDVSTELFSALLIDAAVRYEDYSDFGDTLTGKLAARYALTPRVALRGSIGTGFRAPTPGQQAFSNTQFNTADGDIVITALFPADNAVSRFLGAKPLRPETSFNLTAGLAAALGEGRSFSLDLYRIAIQDQYYRTSSIEVTPDIRQAMLDAGVVGAESVSQVQFFQNALDATVSGVDVVATDRLDWNDGQTTRLTLSFNYNRYTVDAVHIEDLLDAEAIFDFENGLPAWRAVMQAEHAVGAFRLSGRATLWGPYENMFSATAPARQSFDPELMVDLEIAYQINPELQVSLGARNILDNYPAPDLIGEGTANGAIYRSDSVVDWQGGFYFLRFDARF